MKRTTVTLSDDLYNYVFNRAKRMGTSISAVIAHMLDEHIRQYEAIDSMSLVVNKLDELEKKVSRITRLK